VISLVAHRECLREAADQLGWTFFELPCASGSIRGHTVRIYRANELGRAATVILIDLRPSLDLFIGNDDTWNSPNVNPHYQARARALFGGSVWATLGDLPRVGLVKPSDDEIRFVDAREPTPHSIVSAVEMLAEAADAIDARRPHLAVRGELLPLVDAFDSLAKELNLQMIRSPLGVVGRIDEVVVRAFMRANAGEWQLEIEAEYPHAPGIDLSLRPNGRTWPERVVRRLRGRSHVVWSNNVEELRKRLDRATLEDLGRLVNESNFSVDETGLCLVRRSCDDMASLVRKMARIAGVIAGEHDEVVLRFANEMHAPENRSGLGRARES